MRLLRVLVVAPRVRPARDGGETSRDQASVGVPETIGISLGDALQQAVKEGVRGPIDAWFSRVIVPVVDRLDRTIKDDAERFELLHGVRLTSTAVECSKVLVR